MQHLLMIAHCLKRIVPHQRAIKPIACACVWTLFASIALTSCTLDHLRMLINKWGSPDKEKPTIYYEFEGYSPGAKKSKGKEDFSRYHYYIAPDKEEMIDSDPNIYFRQDYEAIEPMPTFDEEQFWRDHPFIIEESTPSDTNPE